MNHTFIMLPLFILLGTIGLSTSRPELQRSRQELKQGNITQELQKGKVGCPYMPPIGKMNTLLYFNGIWRLDRYYILNPRKNDIKLLCSRMDYNYNRLLGGCQTLVHYGVELDQFGNDHPYDYWKTNYIFMRRCVGQFILCDFDSEGNPTSNCHTEVSVLDTDNVNFSIEYSCGREGSIDSAAIIKIFTRRLYFIDDKVTTSLKKLGLKLEDFTLSLDPINPENKTCTLRDINGVTPFNGEIY